MSKKHFSWILVITIAVAVLVLLIPGKTAKENVFESRALLPDLAAQVNDIQRLEIIKQGPETVATLERSGDGWTVAEAAGYPANWKTLRTLLKNLAEAEIIENKTSKPEYYSRLGVEDMAAADASGVLVTLSTSEELAAVIVGKSAQGRQGQYVRLRGNERSVLVDSQLSVARDLPSWLQRSIVDIAASEVVEYTVAHPDGEIVNATKASADDADFQLQNIPEGRETSSSWSVNQVGGALAGLQLEGVKQVGDVDWSDAIRFSLLSADGLLVEAELAENGEDRWIRLGASDVSVSAPAAQSQPEEAEPEESQQEVGQEEAPEEQIAEEAQSEAQSAPSTAERADEINQRVEGWAYRIASYKYDAMAKKMEDLLKTLEDPDQPDES